MGKRRHIYCIRHGMVIVDFIGRNFQTAKPTVYDPKIIKIANKNPRTEFSFLGFYYINDDDHTHTLATGRIVKHEQIALEWPFNLLSCWRWHCSDSIKRKINSISAFFDGSEQLVAESAEKSEWILMERPTKKEKENGNVRLQCDVQAREMTCRCWWWWWLFHCRNVLRVSNSTNEMSIQIHTKSKFYWQNF